MSDSLHEQMSDLLVIAKRFGMPLAEQWIKDHWTPEQLETVTQPPPTATGEICGEPGTKGLVCIRPLGHSEQRHRYGLRSIPKLVTAPVRDWETIESYTHQSGTKHYLIEPGYPVKIEGVPGTHRVVRFERRISDPRIVNVEVISDRGSHSHVYRASMIKYMRPKKAAA